MPVRVRHIDISLFKNSKLKVDNQISGRMSTPLDTAYVQSQNLGVSVVVRRESSTFLVDRIPHLK